MKVKELVESLLEIDQELEVYTAIDDEGNGYNHLHYHPGVFKARKDELEDHRLDSVYTEEDLASEIAEGYIDEDDEFVDIVVI